MTFCYKLDEKHVNGYDIVAMEEKDPYGDRHYYIYVCRHNSPIAIEYVQTARTTWKKKLAQIVQEYN